MPSSGATRVEWLVSRDPGSIFNITVDSFRPENVKKVTNKYVVSNNISHRDIISTNHIVQRPRKDGKNWEFSMPKGEKVMGEAYLITNKLHH